MSDPTAPAGPRPRTVETAITLLWVVIGLYLVGVVIMLVSGALTDALTLGGGAPTLTPEVRAVVVVVVVALTAFFSLLYAGFGVLLALMLRAGRSWPRIVLAVAAGLYVLGLALTVAQAVAFAVNGPSIFVPVGTPVVDLLLSALETAGLVAVVVLLFRRPSSAWFAQRRAARQDAAARRAAGLPGGEAWSPQGEQQPDLYR